MAQRASFVKILRHSFKYIPNNILKKLKVEATTQFKKDSTFYVSPASSDDSPLTITTEDEKFSYKIEMNFQL